jgi:hypothetical protein
MLVNDLSKIIRIENPFTGRVLWWTYLVRALMSLSALAATPAIIRAQDCLPTPPAGWVVPFTMTTHTNKGNNHDLVSYTTGTLTAYRNYFRAGLISDNNRQLFSNQYVDCGTDCLPSQPFDINKPNYIGVDIWVDYMVWPALNGVTLTLDSWGNSKSSFQWHCDTGSNLLYGTVDNSAMVLISFDTPYPPPGPTK